MKKQLYFAVLLMLAILLSAGVVCASDVNVTGSYATSLVDDTLDVSVSNEYVAVSSENSVLSVSNIDNDSSKVSLSSEEVLESDNSNILSTNTNINSENDITSYVAYSDEVVLSASSSSVASESASKSLTTNDNTKLTASIDTMDNNTNGDNAILRESDNSTIISAVYSDGNLIATLTDANGNPISGVGVGFANNGVTYVSTDAKGQARYSTKGLADGTYNVKVAFFGNDVYSPSEKVSVKVVVSRSATHLTSQSVDVVYNSDSYLVATLTDANGNPISGVGVGFANNGVTYVSTDANGQARYSTKGLADGTYNVKVAFFGNDVYSPSEKVSVKVVVSRSVTHLTSQNVDVVYNSDSYLVATLTDANGNPISGVGVGFANNGVTYVSTDANGQAKYSTKGLADGTYNVKVAFFGNDVYSPSEKVPVKVVVSRSVTHLTSQNVNVAYNSDSYLVATLTDANGNPISGVGVGFANNGVTYVSTDANGQAKYSTKGLADGTYNVKVAFFGNDVYSPSEKVPVKVVVTRAVTHLTSQNVNVAYNSDSYLVATLTDANGNPISGVGVGFANNGVTYVSTDANGQAKYSTKGLSAGTHNVKVAFFGNDVYSPSEKLSVTIVVSGMATNLTSQNINVVYKNDSYLVATLTDANGKAIKGASVGFANNGVTYIATDANGQAKYSTKGLAVGTYNVKMKFYGNDVYSESNQVAATIVVADSTTPNAKGYFVFGSDMKNVNLNDLASNGVTDLFLNYYAIEKHGQSAVESWIDSANKLSIKVHIWMQAFYDGTWVNPVVNGAYNTAFSNSKISEAESYAKIKGVSGILLDYLRYPGTAYQTSGGTDAISKFTKLVTDAIHKVNPALIVSVTLMPETTSSAYYYGQDYSAISSYVDAVLPMIYKGNYGKSTSWIKTTAQWYADNSKGAKVWTVLQAYKSDDDVTKLSVSELTTDAKNAVSGGSDGVVLFRYGLSNFINFNELGISSSSSSSSSNGPATISINDILTGANNLKNYYSSNGVYPSTVTAAGHAFTIPEFLYLMSQAAYQLGNSNNNAITCIYGVKAASSPSGDSINAQLYRNDYLTVAKNLANYIKTNNQAPNYASSAVGKISYNVLPDAFSRILAFYKNNDKYMPNYVTIVQGSGSSSSSSYTVGGMNVKNTITNLDAYYKATTNCQVNNAAIKNLVNSLTSGLTTDKEKATVLFNYVRDKIAYSYYYDTKYGAVGTLNAKTGNCVDQAHLLIAMYRAAGLAARYEHGTCYFTLSGNTYGHVWTQVLIDNVWVVGDPTSERNSFGKVVSWNTNSYTHKAYYASLPF